MRGFAHVEFATKDGAEAAVGKAGEKLGGRPLRVDLSNSNRGGGGGARRGGGGGFGGGNRGFGGGNRGYGGGGGGRGYGGGGGRGYGGGGGNFGRGGNSDYRNEKTGAFSTSYSSNTVHEL